MWSFFDGVVVQHCVHQGRHAVNQMILHRQWIENFKHFKGERMWKPGMRISCGKLCLFRISSVILYHSQPLAVPIIQLGTFLPLWVTEWNVSEMTEWKAARNAPLFVHPQIALGISSNFNLSSSCLQCIGRRNHFQTFVWSSVNRAKAIRLTFPSVRRIFHKYRIKWFSLETRIWIMIHRIPRRLWGMRIRDKIFATGLFRYWWIYDENCVSIFD